MTASRWVRLAIMVAGLVIAAYLTVLHYTQGVALCPAVATVVDCQNVLTSPYATQLGVPVAAWGGLFFLLGIGVTVLRPPRPWAMVHAIGGLLVVVALVYTELFLIDYICLWCTAVHALVIANWLILLFAPEPT